MRQDLGPRRVRRGQRPTPGTLELLDRGPLAGRHGRSRDVGPDTAASLAGRSATTAPPPSTTSATSAARCPGAPVAGAIGALVEGGNAPTSSSSPPATTAGTSPPACRCGSTGRCSRTWSTSPRTATRSRHEHAIFGGSPGRDRPVHRRRPRDLRGAGQVLRRRAVGGGRRAGRGGRRSPSRRHQRGRRSSPATSRSAPGPSSTRPRSWCRAVVGSGPPRTTP